MICKVHKTHLRYIKHMTTSDIAPMWASPVGGKLNYLCQRFISIISLRWQLLSLKLRPPCQGPWISCPQGRGNLSQAEEREGERKSLENVTHRENPKLALSWICVFEGLHPLKCSSGYRWRGQCYSSKYKKIVWKLLKCKDFDSYSLGYRYGDSCKST
jgi:hypothetical protein